MLYTFENTVLYDHGQTFTQMYDAKLRFRNRLKSEIPTKMSGEGSLSSDETISVSLVCAS